MHTIDRVNTTTLSFESTIDRRRYAAWSAARSAIQEYGPHLESAQLHNLIVFHAMQDGCFDILAMQPKPGFREFDVVFREVYHAGFVS